jgi:adenosylmethionine-8-amino-7-oxononanoate aminotransferase
MAAILVSPMVLEGIKSEQFIHGLTFDCNPVGAAAALEVANFIKERNLIDNVHKQGVLLEQGLKAELSHHKNVGEIRGIGLMWGIEFVKDKITKEPFDSEIGLAQKIVDKAKLPPYNMTFYVSTGFVDGVRGDCIIIMPPYTVTSTDINHIVDVLSGVINKVLTEINTNK